MSNYLYNDIELPQLPEWDKATYPYAVITVEENATINKVHALWCSKNPAIYYNLMKQLQFGGETGATSVLNDGDTEWGELYESELTHNNAGCAVIWANYDVHYCQYQGNGSYVATDEIFLPASDPVPVPDEPETVLAWKKHDAYKPNSKSIAYLYNGVELPDINTVWTDKATYPCAIIARGIPNGTYYLTVCGDKPYYTEQSYGTEGYEPIVVAPKPFKGFSCVGGSWVLNTEDTGYGAALRTGTFELIWTNVDVMNKDNGSVYFNGSDPVIKGWDGNTFYRVMGGKWVKQDEFASDAKAEPEVENCLTFSSAEAFTIATNNAAKNWDGALYHSTDGNTWSEWDGVTAIESAKHNGEQRIYMRGVGNSVITGDVYQSYWALTGSSVRCDGNIENLLDYETVANGGHPTMGEYCYDGLFFNWTALTTAPELPATTLSSNCYAYMFAGCTALTTAPELPATTVGPNSYGYMFDRCTGLTTAPALPATTLSSHSYYCMFSDCTGLTTLPALPATELKTLCYGFMFCNCTGIKLSTTQTDEYQTEYRIPISGTGTFSGLSYLSPFKEMFKDTGGTFTDDPTINTTYYTSNTVV